MVLILGVAAYNYQTIETGIVSYASNMPSTTKNTTVTTSLVGATICSHGFWASLLDANCIDASWVHEFMANISLMGRVSFTENTQLDQLAQERFNTAVTQPDITHYGGNSEIPPGVGEVIYYPAGSSPSAYAHNDVQKGAPGHYNLMVSYGFTQYGYYLGQGKIAESSGCSVTELPGPDINVTQFLQQHGCQVTWVTSTWLVIDMR